MTTPQILICVIVLAVTVLFIWGRWRYDLVAFGGLMAATAVGVIPTSQTFDGFSHPAVITVLALFIWWPAMAASEYRSTPAPPWGSEVERIKAKCLSDPAFIERPIFTPFWPPNWGDGLDEPTHPNLPCTVVFRWLG